MAAPSISANKLERTVAVLSPGLASRIYMRRMAFSGAYSVTGPTRYRKTAAYGRSQSGSEEKTVGSYDRNRLILEGQDQLRNGGMVPAICGRFASYAVFKGIFPTATTSDPEWNRTADHWWRDAYCPTCDYRGISDMTELLKLAVTGRIWQGGVLFVMLRNGQLDPIEYERVQTPSDLRSNKNVHNGVKTTARGKLLGFYICDRKDGGSVDLTSWRYVKEENCVHYWEPWRFDQLLALPTLAPILEEIIDFKETHEHIRLKIKSEAKRLAFRTKGKGGKTMAINAGFRGMTETDAAGKTREVVTHEWGEEYMGEEGEEFHLLSGETPNANSIEYQKWAARLICSRFGVPYEFMLMIFETGSFSTHRAVSLHSQHAFEEVIDDLVRKMLRKVYRWRIAKAMNEGTLPLAPVDQKGVSEWWQAEWTVPFFEANDLNKQAEGHKKYVELGVETVEHLIRQRNRDPEDVVRENERWLDRCALAVERHNQKHPGTPVSIDHFSNAATPGAAAEPAQKNEEPDDADKPKEE